MLKENTDEIRMEIQSCFVKTHEYWEKRRGGKNWIAHITGLDKKYGYKREFLETVKVGKTSTLVKISMRSGFSILSPLGGAMQGVHQESISF